MILAISSAVTAGLAEGLVRIADGNALPMIRLFEADASGHIALEPNGFARISAPFGAPWEIHTDTDGRRVAPESLTERAWIVVGDSQVMGNGVADGEAFPALLRLDGEAAHNLGVPGYGVADALWSATQHLDQSPTTGGVIVIVNQMNDWEETEAPVGERYKVRGGWLVDAEDADTSRGVFLSSPLSRTHLGFLLGHLVLRDWDPPQTPVPNWMLDPTAQRTTTLRIANAVRSFADTHKEIPVIPVYLPADVYASAGRAETSPLTPHLTELTVNPWEDNRLQNQILTALSDLEPIDLTGSLGDEGAFLQGDYHLSPFGHQQVAQAIMRALAQRSQSEEPSSVKEETPGQ